MSLARKCDRCGTYHDGRLYKVTVEQMYPSVEYCDDDLYDLCPDCKIEFDDFMNGVKPNDLLSRLHALFKKE